MKNTITTFLVLTIATNFFMASAQQTEIIKRDSLNSQMLKIAKPESEPNWIQFKDNTNTNPTTVFIEFKLAFDLKETDKMVIYKIEKDDLGFTHYWYQQYFKNIKIDGGTYIVHTNKNGFIYAANGKILTGIDINTVPILSATQAIDLTLKNINAKEYMWQSEFWEKDLRERTRKPDTTYFPVPQLTIREIRDKHKNPHTQGKQYFLAYRLDIYSSSPNFSQRVFIDANTGVILETFPLQSN